jgi:hypothetical protein
MPRPIYEFVRFDAMGWQRESGIDDPNLAVWYPPRGGAVSLNGFPLPPDLPQEVTLSGFRRSYKALLSPESGLVELEIVRVGQVPAVRSVIRQPAGPEPKAGIAYIGSYTVPFAPMSFVIKAQAVEGGVTGLRESVILDEATGAGRVVWDAQDLTGWVIDSDWSDSNLAEESTLDERFPWHPLSLVRAYLRQVADSLQIDEELLRQAPFPLPAKP